MTKAQMELFMIDNVKTDVFSDVSFMVDIVVKNIKYGAEATYVANMLGIKVSPSITTEPHNITVAGSRAGDSEYLHLYSIEDKCGMEVTDEGMDRRSRGHRNLAVLYFPELKQLVSYIENTYDLSFVHRNPQESIDELYKALGMEVTHDA